MQHPGFNSQQLGFSPHRVDPTSDSSESAANAWRSVAISYATHPGGRVPVIVLLLLCETETSAKNNVNIANDINNDNINVMTDDRPYRTTTRRT